MTRGRPAARPGPAPGTGAPDHERPPVPPPSPEWTDRIDRLARAAEAGGLRFAFHAPPRRLGGGSQDVWAFDDLSLGPVVLRVAWGGGLDRVDREALVLRHLPAEVPHPEPLGHGRAGDGGPPLAYSVTRRPPGRPLHEAWPSLDAARRRSAVRGYAAALRALHTWSPPAEVAAVLAARPEPSPGGPAPPVGADTVPLPVERGLALVDHALELPGVDRGVLAAARDMVTALADAAPVVDDPAAHGPVHGCARPADLWWHGGAPTLLGWERVRAGPPDLELRAPVERADTAALAGEPGRPELLEGLALHYPELFAHPRLTDRLRLYSLLRAVRQVVVLRPRGPWSELPAADSGNRLWRLVRGRRPAPGVLPRGGAAGGGTGP